MTTKVIPVEAGHRIQLPAEWTQELGVGDLVTLEKTPEGIVVRPYSRASWDEVFATKLPVKPSVATEVETLEVTGDDLLY